MEYSFEILTETPEALSTSLTDRAGRLRERIYVSDQVTLAPQFIALPSARAVGGFELLAFVLTIPVGIAASLAASYIYDWLRRHKVRSIRLGKRELIVGEDGPRFVETFVEITEQEPP